MDAQMSRCEAVSQPLRVGGAAASLAVAGFLLALLAFRGPNALGLWSVLAGGAGGLSALVARARWQVLVSSLLVVMAAIPALPGGLGLLFLPSLVLLLLATLLRA